MTALLKTHKKKIMKFCTLCLLTAVQVCILYFAKNIYTTTEYHGLTDNRQDTIATVSPSTPYQYTVSVPERNVNRYAILLMITPAKDDSVEVAVSDKSGTILQSFRHEFMHDFSTKLELIIGDIALKHGESYTFTISYEGSDANDVKIVGDPANATPSITFFYPKILKKNLGFLLILFFFNVLLFMFSEKIRNFLSRRNKIFVGVIDILALLLFALVSYIGCEYTSTATLPSGSWIAGNTMLLFFIYAALFLLLKSPAVSLRIGAVFFYFAGILNHFIIMYRKKPFTFSDIKAFKTVMGVADKYEFPIADEFYVWALLTMTLLALAGCIPHRTVTKKGYLISLGSFAAFATGMLLIFTSASFVQRSGIEINTLDMVESYETYGMGIFTVYSSSNMQRMTSDYDFEKTLSVLEEASDITIPYNGKITPKNLIVVMNESLTDFAALGLDNMSEDPLSYIHSLDKNTQKGTLYVSTFGGGTSNTEFEVLTGNSMLFEGGTTPYQDTLGEDTLSMPRSLKKHGFTTHSFHPYNKDFYGRDYVYDYMQFDSYIALEDMKEDFETIRHLCSDSADYKKLISIYEEARSASADAPFFLFNITIQNHGGYGDADYNSTIIVDNGSHPLAQQYLSLAKESDRAFGELLSYFEQVDEPTMIVMFGDHHPSLEPDIYEMILGKPADQFTPEEKLIQYQTPLIIWTNYDSESKDIGNISTNFLQSYILKEANLPMTSYQKYLYRLHEEIPVISAYGCIDAEGTVFTYEEGGPHYDRLKEYEHIQYTNMRNFSPECEAYFY